MTGGPTLDDALELARVLPAADLEDLVAAVARALGGAVAVFDPRGARLAGDRAAGEPTHDVDHDGERVARLAVSGPQAEAARRLTTDVLGLLLHHAHARALAATTHDAAMAVSFAELTEHNTRLRRAVVRLEELDRLKSNFLATMSHELRTPLTSVIGYAEMMAEGMAGPVSPEQRDYLTTILGKAEQLLGMITTVLEVTTLDAGDRGVERCALDLAELVASEVAALQPQASRRGVALAVAPGDGIVLGDKKKLRQVVASLLSNAVKFTPDGGRVGVALRPGPLAPDDEGPHGVQLVVSDSGIGIARDQLANIFEPFFQIDSSTTRAFGGSGLGLTLARAYVEAHGGRIWVDSSPGQGSTFVAALPAAPAFLEAPASVAAPGAPGAGEGAR